MKCPVPPILKASLNVVDFDDAKYQEPKEVPKAKAGKHSSKEKAKRAPSGRSNRTTAVDGDDSDWPETSKKTACDV
ncbi:hypothetical protein SeLEV6574_g04762 [Synchytrium endobioticum]|uniref:Uncharacterized protein n=1 Tax=Synchytrium endobioticum TaxID=286115 RepID=A0A507CYA0_9FUNG|nr:hypothetical protein SeLEV6574_g04762 [Synchytrium endobioticum]